MIIVSGGAVSGGGDSGGGDGGVGGCELLPAQAKVSKTRHTTNSTVDLLAIFIGQW